MIQKLNVQQFICILYASNLQTNGSRPSLQPADPVMICTGALKVFFLIILKQKKKKRNYHLGQLT